MFVFVCILCFTVKVLPSLDSCYCILQIIFIKMFLCSSRFIINIPETELRDIVRVFFQIELAHWFYLDYYCAENPDVKSCGIKEFSSQNIL